MDDVVEQHLDTGNAEGSVRTRLPSAGYALGLLRHVDLAPGIRTYLERIEATFEEYGGRWLVHGSRPEVLEGPWPEDVVLIGFPSVDAARDWYSSPSYQELLALRTAHSAGRVVLLEGVAPGYRAAETVAKLFTA